MKKVIKVQDIRNMVKKFNLNEDEQFELEDMASDINSEKGDIAVDVHATFYFDTRNKAREAAAFALIIYFGKKAQEEIGTYLNETTWEIGRLLKVGSYQLRRWFFSAHFYPRFAKYVNISDTFGLNYLEIE